MAGSETGPGDLGVPDASPLRTAIPAYHWLRLGMAHAGGVSTLFGTQHIITDQWVRLDKPFHGRSGRFLDPSCRDTHWVPLKNRGRHDCNHASSAPARPRPFSWGGVTILMVMTVRLAPRHWLRLVKRPHRPHWLRLGIAHVAGESALFGTQHIITDQWVRLDKPFHGRSGRFLDPSCRDTHWVRLAPRHWLRLVKRPHRPHWLRLGMPHVAGESTLFGTQHIITDQWVRLDKPFHGRSRPFSRLIMPRYPLGSSENRGRHDCNHANLAPPIFIGWGEHSDGHDCSFGETASQTQLASFGESPCRRGIDIFRDSTRQNWYWLALKIGDHTTAITQSGPRPFSWDRVTFRGHDDSFGEADSRAVSPTL